MIFTIEQVLALEWLWLTYNADAHCSLGRAAQMITIEIIYMLNFPCPVLNMLIILSYILAFV